MTTSDPPCELRVTAPAVAALREHLFPEPFHERFAYCTATQTDDALLVPAEAVHPVADDTLHTATPAAANMTMAAEQDWLEHCLQTDATPLLFHSHPPGGTAAFSGSEETLDVQAARAYDTFAAQLLPGHGFGFGVLTLDTMHVAYTPPTAELAEHDAFSPRPAVPLDIAVRGGWRLDPPLETWVSDRQNQPVTAPEPAARWDDATTVAAADADDHAAEQPGHVFEQYDRQLRVITAANQEALTDAHITIVGAGGLGSWLAVYLARMGVGALTIVDPDVIEESNLSRLWAASLNDVGRPKVEVLRETLAAVTPACKVTPITAPVEDHPGVVRGHRDAVVSTVDNHATALWLHDEAVAHLQPLIDAGVLITLEDDPADEPEATGEDAAAAAAGVAQMRSTCQTTVPEVTACRTCMDRVDPEQARLDWLSSEERAAEVERGYVAETAVTPDPAVLFLNGFATSLAAQQVINVVTGFEAPTGIVEFDAATMDLRAWKTAPAPDCAVCSPDAGLLGAGTRLRNDRSSTDHEEP